MLSNMASSGILWYFETAHNIRRYDTSKHDITWNGLPDMTLHEVTSCEVILSAQPLILGHHLQESCDRMGARYIS